MGDKGNSGVQVFASMLAALLFSLTGINWQGFTILLGDFILFVPVTYSLYSGLYFRSISNLESNQAMKGIFRILG